MSSNKIKIALLGDVHANLPALEAALLETGGTKAAACRLLGISRPTMDKKINELNIEV